MRACVQVNYKAAAQAIAAHIIFESVLRSARECDIILPIGRDCATDHTRVKWRTSHARTAGRTSRRKGGKPSRPVRIAAENTA